MGLRDVIHQQVQALVTENGTNDPIVIAKFCKVPVYWQTMGNIVLGYFSNFYNTPIITLSDRLNAAEERYVCAHELGHFFCNHTDAVYCLNWNTIQQSYVNTSKAEAEAHIFATELTLAGIDLHDCQTQQEVMYQAGLPYWAIKYIKWDTLQQPQTV